LLLRLFWNFAVGAGEFYGAIGKGEMSESEMVEAAGLDVYPDAAAAMTEAGGGWLERELAVKVVILATVIGLAVPLLTAVRSDGPRPAPSLVIRSGAVGLGLSSALMAVCSLLHFSDDRWLAVS
jgi:hypothetical protein